MSEDIDRDPVYVGEDRCKKCEGFGTVGPILALTTVCPRCSGSGKEPVSVPLLRIIPIVTCGPTAGCGKSVEMIHISDGGFKSPERCPHCGNGLPEMFLGAAYNVRCDSIPD